MQGHLTVITSSSEQAFIESILPTDKIRSFYLGGSRNNEGSWEWVTGEPWLYENWHPDQPDNDKGNQSKLRMVYAPKYSWEMDWDDISNEGNTE